jgi:hypothetical protein
VGGDGRFSFEPLWQRCRADVGLEAVRLRRGAVFQLVLQFFFSFEVALYCTFQGSRDPMDLERRIYWLLGLGQVRGYTCTARVGERMGKFETFAAVWLRESKGKRSMNL